MGNFLPFAKLSDSRASMIIAEKSAQNYAKGIEYGVRMLFDF